MSQTSIPQRQKLKEIPSPIKEKNLFSSRTPVVPDQIENKIKSRRRVLEILEDQTSCIDDEQFLQIQSRDLMIEELTKELIEVKSAIKLNKLESEDLIKLKSLTQRVNDLDKERLVLIQEFEDIEEMKKIGERNMEDERREFEKLLESVNEENSLLRTQVNNKEEEIQAMIQDIGKLSDIIKQFKKMNSDLNQDITKLNEDMETLKVKFYESEVKSAAIPELEASLNECIRNFRSSERKEEAAKAGVHNLMLAYEDLEAFVKHISDQLAVVVEGIEADSQNYKVINEIIQEIGKKKPLNLDKSQKKNKEKVEKRKIGEIADKLERTERELRIVENQQKPLNDQILGLKELISVIKKDHSTNVENLNQSMKLLQDMNSSLQSEIQTCRVENGRKEGKISTLNSKIINLDNLLSKQEEKLKKVLEVKNQMEKSNIDLKEKLTKFSTIIEDKKKEISKLNNQNLNLTANVQALHEEFWKKDNILLKMKKNTIRLEKTLSDLNKVRLEMPKTQEGTEKLLKEIYEKDHKIEVLKDMLKSMKKKEKSKSKDLSIDQSLETHPEKYEKTEKDLLNSLVSKIINKFFSICTFNKTSAETPPEIPRLIKKLRQDLRMYSAFNTRDLQLSVPLLSQSLTECRAHLNLEELITIVSKVAYSL